MPGHARSLSVVLALTFLFSLFVGWSVFRMEGVEAHVWQFEIGGRVLDKESFGLRTLEPDPETGEMISRPTMIHEPLYPMLVSLVLVSTGLGPGALVVFQAMLHAFTTLLVLLTARTVVSRRVAWLAAIVAGLDPTLLSATGRPTEENLSVFLMAAMGWIFMKFHPHQRAWQAVLLGAGMGMLSLARFQGVAFSLLALLFLAIMVWRRGGHVFMWRQVGLFCATWIIVLTPWIVRNRMTFGKLRIAPSRVMWTLCEKAAILNEGLAYSDVPRYAVGLYSTRLSERLFGAADSLGDQRSVRYCREIRDRIMQTDSDELRAENELGRATLELVLENPVKYLLVVLVSPISLLGYEIEAISFGRSKLERKYGSGVWMAMNASLRLLSACVWLSAVLGARQLVSKGSGQGRLLVCLVFGYIFPHIITRIHSHFVISVLPLLIVVGAAAFSRGNHKRSEVHSSQ